MPRSSPAFAPRLFEPDPSLYITLWWAGVHLLLGGAVLALDLAALLTLIGLAAIALHGSVRFPRGPKLLVLHGDGTWAVPERGWHGLRLAPNTAWTTWYVELVLFGVANARIVLLKDQLGAEDWRALQLAVREHDDSSPRSIA